MKQLLKNESSSNTVNTVNRTSLEESTDPNTYFVDQSTELTDSLKELFLPKMNTSENLKLQENKKEIDLFKEPEVFYFFIISYLKLDISTHFRLVAMD